MLILFLALSFAGVAMTIYGLLLKDRDNSSHHEQ